VNSTSNRARPARVHDAAPLHPSLDGACRGGGVDNPSTRRPAPTCHPIVEQWQCEVVSRASVLRLRRTSSPRLAPLRSEANQRWQGILETTHRTSRLYEQTRRACITSSFRALCAFDVRHVIPSRSAATLVAGRAFRADVVGFDQVAAGGLRGWAVDLRASAAVPKGSTREGRGSGDCDCRRAYCDWPLH